MGRGTRHSLLIPAPKSLKIPSGSLGFVNTCMPNSFQPKKYRDLLVFQIVFTVFLKGGLSSALVCSCVHMLPTRGTQLLAQVPDLPPMEIKFHSTFLNFAFLVHDIGALEMLNLKLGVDCHSQLGIWAESPTHWEQQEGGLEMDSTRLPVLSYK